MASMPGLRSANSCGSRTDHSRIRRGRLKLDWTCGNAMLESRALRGAVAQLGERRVRNAKVEGSIPFRSTNPLFLDDPKWSPAPFTNSGKQALLVVPAGQVGPSDSPA